MIIGVIADTHVGEFLDDIPAQALEALAGSDLILHAGDLSDGSVIPVLEQIAPVVAVRGDHDLASAPRLPARAVVQAGNVRIGLVHGKRRSSDALVVAAHALAGRRIGFNAHRARAMARAFRAHEVHAVVFGHWHEAMIEHVDGVVVFSPGAVCPWGSLEGGRPPRAGAAGIADRVVRRYRRQLGADAMRPSVGRLRIDGDSITPEIVALT
jgi:putative phosphoesterase